jgi:hypothetical protein
MAAGAGELRGNVYFFYDSYSVCMQEKGGIHKRFGSSDPEPFLITMVYSPESEANCKASHRFCKNNGWQGTWQDCYAQVPNFPSRLPLRLFINRDGSYKKEGDEISLKFGERCVILTCAFEEEKNFDGRYVKTFSEGMAARVRHSIECRWITQENVEQAQVGAKNSPEWIDVV